MRDVPHAGWGHPILEPTMGDRAPRDHMEVGPSETTRRNGLRLAAVVEPIGGRVSSQEVAQSGWPQPCVGTKALNRSAHLLQIGPERRLPRCQRSGSKAGNGDCRDHPNDDDHDQELHQRETAPHEGFIPCFAAVLRDSATIVACACPHRSAVRGSRWCRA